MELRNPFRQKNKYASTYKACTQHFFNKINNYLGYPVDVSCFKDIIFLNGYYIFDFGTNSVVHFRISRCAGWLFGIWWEKPEKKQEDIHGKVFAQFEETIDKFKPSASASSEEFTVNPKTGEMTGLDRVISMVNFISYTPYSAFCRQYGGYGWDNEYTITEEEAKKEYEEYLFWKENKKNIRTQF